MAELSNSHSLCLKPQDFFQGPLTHEKAFFFLIAFILCDVCFPTLFPLQKNNKPTCLMTQQLSCDGEKGITDTPNLPLVIEIKMSFWMVGVKRRDLI